MSQLMMRSQASISASSGMKANGVSKYGCESQKLNIGA
jgi:hypothetical protein